MQRATITGLLAGAAALAVLIVPRLPGVVRPPELYPDGDPGPAKALSHSSSGALRLSAALDREELLRGSEAAPYLVIEVSAPGEPEERLPVHVALVFDTSGSMMEDDRIADARAAALGAVSRLSPQDTLSLVTFDDQARLRIPRTRALEPALFSQAIQGLMPGGGTNLYDGLVRGLDELRADGEDGVRRVILLSDGEANIGETDPERIVAAAASKVSEGVTVSALGVGTDFNEDLLAALADASGGSWRFADHAGAITELLGGELDRMARVAAQEATLDVSLAEGVRLDGVYGWEARPRTGGFQVFLGDLHAGETRKIVARLHVSTASTGALPVADARLRYHDPREGASLQQVRVQGTVTEDAAAADRARDRSLIKKIGDALVGEAIERSAGAWSSGREDEAREQIRQAEQDLRELGQPAAEVPALGTWIEAVDTPMAEADEKAAIKRAKEAARVIAR